MFCGSASLYGSCSISCISSLLMQTVLAVWYRESKYGAVWFTWVIAESAVLIA
jgi:hypothetical protein